MSNSNFPNAQNQSGGAIPVYIGGATGANITTATTTLVKTGAGTISGVTVNTAGAGSIIKIYDGLTNAGTLLATISSAAQVSLSYGLAFATGLCVVTSGGTPADVTIQYH